MKKFIRAFLCLLIAQLAIASELATIRPKGNATVPVDAPIQPPQAFVDATAATDLAEVMAGSFPSALQSKGITSISPVYVESFLINGTSEFDLTGNALTVESVNAILGMCSLHEEVINGTLDLSGGTNAAPTGQGITDKATLISAGWTVTTN